MKLSSTRRSWLLILLAFLAPALIGISVGLAGERNPVGAAVLYSEPLLIALALYGVLALLSERRWLVALGLAAGSMLATVIVHLPADPLPVTDVEADWSNRLRDCANLVERPRAPVRVLSWTLDEKNHGAVDVDALLAARPDLIVLHGLKDPGPADEIARRLRGESKFLAGQDAKGGTALIARGAFQYCGGRDDIWEMPLPTAEGGGARAILTFPEIVDVGVVPFLAVQLDQPGPPRDWLRWPARVVQGSRHVAAVVRALGPRRMVVAGDFASPRSFRRVAGHLLGAGLTEVDVPASWPANLGPVPGITVHALDRVWLGESWSETSTEGLQAEGHGRLPLLVEIAPI